MAYEKKEQTNLVKLFTISRTLDGAVNGYFTSDRVIKAERELNELGEYQLYFNEKEMQIYAECNDLLRKFFEKQTNKK